MKIDETQANTVADQLIAGLDRDQLTTHGVALYQAQGLHLMATVATANNLDRIATVLERLAPIAQEKGPQAEAQEPETPEAPYSYHACVFNHCPHPDVCKSTMSGCVQVASATG